MPSIVQKKGAETDSLFSNGGSGDYIPGRRGKYLIFDIL